MNRLVFVKVRKGGMLFLFFFLLFHVPLFLFPLLCKVIYPFSPFLWETQQNDFQENKTLKDGCIVFWIWDNLLFWLLRLCLDSFCNSNDAIYICLQIHYVSKNILKKKRKGKKYDYIYSGALQHSKSFDYGDDPSVVTASAYDNRRTGKVRIYVEGKLYFNHVTEKDSSNFLSNQSFGSHAQFIS